MPYLTIAPPAQKQDHIQLILQLSAYPIPNVCQSVLSVNMPTPPTKLVIFVIPLVIPVSTLAPNAYNVLTMLAGSTMLVLPLVLMDTSSRTMLSIPTQLIVPPATTAPYAQQLV